MTVGEKIKSLRTTQNISQQALADYLNISRQAISRWENNTSLPDLTTLIAIAKFFNIPLDFFSDETITETNSAELPNSDKPSKKVSRDEVLQEATPYILVLVVILTLIARLPARAKVPIIFFGTIIIIFLMSCLLIYYIIKNYLSK
ncbi:helix-turn-helix domain-containing protein [Enterococcus sp. HY326]|uniref:helix-turn-helix domain-containing protein n=1 Tax=Enterococcus sp. HY326 TaxID=2971265 RepID=UPI00223F7D71|nr:helix-turn-helix transcriptional regulator [Enterococcus sp. HY326]